jgi:hypothetical protein
VNRRTALQATTTLGLLLLSLSACTGGVKLSSRTMCEAAGGAYAGRTCNQSSASPRTAQQMCDAHGGVYLAGEDVCALGEGVK